MEKIQLLDSNTINQIAAGEVVERPCAVVKELVENAIDAGATGITVEIKGGGIDFIRITDNGSGIPKDQIAIAFERHATSKIRTAMDLLSVASLGFRGEALASISAVAQVELVTKTRGELTGARYVIEGGEEKGQEEIGCPEGTTFVVRNLFFNTPARRKFLKSAQTEAAYISDFVERLAISHPNISFKFLNNNQLKLNTSGNGNQKDIIYHIYGRDITAQLLSVESSSEMLSISGFIAKPVVSRGNRNYMNYFINGRYIKSNIINKAIEEAYKPYSMQHRYPMTALYFEIDSQYIDVNVHPTKMEVRFTNEQGLYHEILDTISSVLARREMIPEVTLAEKKKEEKPEKKEAAEPFEVQRKKEERVQNTVKKSNIPEKSAYTSNAFAEQRKGETSGAGKQILEAAKVIRQFETLQEESSYGKERKVEKDFAEEKNAIHENTSISEKNVTSIAEEARKPVEPTKENRTEEKAEMKTKDGEEKKDKNRQISLFDEPLLSKQAKKEHRIIGQVFQTYWIVEYGEKMFFIDQHAAHEKVLFEKTMASLADKSFSSQLLEPPIILSLSMREEEALKRFMPELKKIGFEIDSFGGREFSVRAVPANLFGIGQVELLTEFIGSLTEEMNLKDTNIILEKVASMSCKAAVKGKMKMSFAEAEALIDSLMELENPYHCPHGRPVIVSMSKYELEKKFKRIL